MVVVDKFLWHFEPDLSGHCSEVALVLIMLGRDLGWSLLTGGCYSELVVNTSLTVLLSNGKKHNLQDISLIYSRRTWSTVYTSSEINTFRGYSINMWYLFLHFSQLWFEQGFRRLVLLFFRTFDREPLSLSDNDPKISRYTRPSLLAK